MGSVYRRGYRDRRSAAVRKTKTYTIKYRDGDGRWVAESTDTTSRVVALRLLAEREARAAGPAGGVGVRGPGGRDPDLEEIREHFLGAMALRLKPSTCRMYAERLAFTLRDMGRASPEAVAPPGIDDYVRGRLEAGASPRTVNLQVSVLRRMLAWAREHRLIDDNPLEKWKPVRDQGACRRRALTPEEVRRLLDAAPPWRRILWMTMAATGIRKGEAIRLLVSDFDPGRRVIRLRPEITKTSRGRTCPIPSGLGRLLEEYLRRRGRNEPGKQREYVAMIGRRLAEESRAGRDDLPRADRLRRMEAAATESTGHRHLFANSKGMQIRHNLDREFRADLRRAGIDGPGLSIHSLRYTANTSLLAAGVPETVVRARMGHVTQRMTDRYYDPDGDDGKGTGAMAALIGVEDRGEEAALAHPSGPYDLSPGIPVPEPIRPTAELLGCLSGRFSNVAIGKILGVSEAAVRKAMKRMGIAREERICSKLGDCEAALVRSEIRLALGRRASGSGGDDRRSVGRAG